MDISDLQIAKSIKAKDVEIFEKVIDKYSKQAYFIAYSILHISCTKEDIEECVSDVFLEVWSNIDDYNPEKASFKTWLFMLTKYNRKISKYKTINIDELIIEDKENIDMVVISKEDQEKVISIMNDFNKVDKELFFRRYFCDEKIKSLMTSFDLTRSAIDRFNDPELRLISFGEPTFSEYVDVFVKNKNGIVSTSTAHDTKPIVAYDAENNLYELN